MSVGIGIIGCGKISLRYGLPNFLKSKKAKVVALCDINLKKAQSLKEKFSLKNVDTLRDYKDLVHHPRVDAVYVALPNYLHAPVAIFSANAKKHVLVEKPITINLRDADRMISACRKNKVILMVEQTQRFDPIHEKAKEILDSGILGRINNIRGRIGHAGPEYWSDDSPWFLNKSQSGGGAIVDVGVHILDLLRWFAGKKKIVEVRAIVDTLEKKVKVDDNALALLQFDDGSVGSFEASWTTRPYEVTTFTYGQSGKMVTSIGKPDPIFLSLAKKGKKEDPNQPQQESSPKPSLKSRHTSAWHYFVECVDKNKEPFINGEEGRKTLEVILAAYLSQRTGKVVKLPLKS